MLIEVHQTPPLLDNFPRVPGRCLSLIYCAERATASLAALGENAERARQTLDVTLLHRWQCVRAARKFRSNRMLIKLVLLQLLGRDFWLAVTPDRVAGMIGVRRDHLSSIPLQPDEACVYSVTVNDEFKGRRLGLLLLETVTRQLIDAGCTRVLLETGEHNASMRALLGRTLMYRFCGVSQRPPPVPQPKTIF